MRVYKYICANVTHDDYKFMYNVYCALAVSIMFGGFRLPTDLERAWAELDNLENPK